MSGNFSLQFRAIASTHRAVTIKANDGTTVVDVILKVLKKLRVAGALGVLSRPPHQVDIPVVLVLGYCVGIDWGLHVV